MQFTQHVQTETIYSLFLQITYGEWVYNDYQLRATRS